MTTPSHRVDVLIPVYNAAATIREAVGSILEQTVRDIVVHVVDDGSSDATPGILAEMAAADARIRVHTKANGGIVEALNHGLAHCEAPLLARHDADDVAYPHRLAWQLAYLEEHPDCVAVGAAVRHIDVAGRPTGSVGDLTQADEADSYAYPSREPYVIHPFLTVRRDALRRAGGYRHVLHAEDTDLYWRLRTLGRLHNPADLLGEYRIHASSLSGASARNVRLASAYAQLAALSERRRRDGRPDLVLDRASVEAVAARERLADILEAMASAYDLDAGERAYLELATAMKVLVQAAYRPVEPDLGDCHLIRAAVRRGSEALDPAGRAFAARLLSGTAARLVARGEVAAGLALLPPGLWRPFLVRLGLRIALPEALRRQLRTRLVSREAMK